MEEEIKNLMKKEIDTAFDNYLMVVGSMTLVSVLCGDGRTSDIRIIEMTKGAVK
jgi:hypothetical protein